MSRYDEKEKRALFVFILVFILLVAGISTGGYISYQNFEQQFRMQAESQLSAIAELKVKELANWREERLADAEMLHQNQAFATLVQDYINEPQDARLQNQIQDWLGNYHIYKEYDRIRLLDVNGQTLLSIPEGLPPLSPSLTVHIPEVLQSRQVTLIDFYRREDDSQIRLALLIPILQAQSGGQVLGVVSISIDPETYLYPFINEWPSNSATAETLLVRRDGTDLLYLNELRFQTDTALNLRYPLEHGFLAAQAVLGKTGVVDGTDYRGVPVVGALRAIPASPWFLVARMDTTEIYAPLRDRLWQTFLVVGMAIFVAGAGLTTLWRQQRILYYRRQAEAAKAAKENEKQLQEAQTIARMGSYLFDFSAETWKSSAVLDRIFGIDENFERSAAGWAALIHPDDRQYMVDYFTGEVIGNRTRFDREYRIIRNSDLVERWVHGFGELEFDAGGKLVSMLGTIQDITESKRAEEVIRRSDEKYRRVVETANEGIFFLDGDTRITFTNQRMALMLGYTTEEMLDQKLESFLAEGPLSESSSQMKDRAQGMDEVYEQCFKTKDGGKHWTLMSPRAIFDSDGNLEGFFGMLTDIHERRQVEEKMRQLSRAVEQSPVSIVITDINGVIQYVNPRFTHITGYTLEESLSQNPRMLKSGETTQEDYKQLWDTILTGGEWRGEFHNRKKNGELYWESASISPVKDNSGRITHFLAVKEDITERKRTEEQLAAYAEHLGELVDERTRELRTAQEQLVRQERLALLGQVAGSIGHELRNPLGVISNAIYFLKLAQPNVSDKVKEYLTIIENEARASDKIITDLLDFTRLRSVDREAVPVSDVIHETFERFPVPLDVSVALDIPADLPKIFVDPHNLVQVLGNLTLNACQAMTSPGVSQRGELTISAALQNNMVRMNVQDTGIGIPAENMPKLFEPLFTTKTKGIGLGLAVSKKLVEANGGRIEVKSEAGLGSTFTLWLPVAESSSRRIDERDPH